MTTRHYPLDSPCEDCGQTPTRWIRFWVNAMPYRVCKEHAAEYRHQTLGSDDWKKRGPFDRPVHVEGYP